MTYSMETLHLLDQMKDKKNDELCAKVIELARKVYLENGKHDIHFYARVAATGTVLK